MRMKHIYREGKSKQANVFLLLHGTGGTEEDLLSLQQMIDPDAAILSVRGNVLENGMPRFFRRLREGVFDEEDLVKRTEELYQFLDEAAEEYGFSRDHVIALGYSNGANIAGSLLFHYSNSLKGAALFHPMVPRRNIELANQQDLPVFIGAGENDPICPAKETEDLMELLEHAGAKVTVHWERMGHQLTKSEIDAAKDWYQTKFN